jgi:tousled-like kinase
MEKEKLRLGEFTQRRESVRFIEEWEEGCEIKSLKEEIRVKEMEREDLERQKKEVKSRKGENSNTLITESIDGSQRK